MRTAASIAIIPPDAPLHPVWLFPRRPSGWSGPHVTLDPWLPPIGGWSDRIDPVRFARELVRDLRQRDVDRYWSEINAAVPQGREPLLVTAPIPVHLTRVVRRTVATWFERAGKGTVPEHGQELPPLAELLGADPWAS